MRKLPPHVQEYLRKSPYGPFTELEVAHLAAKIERGHFPADGDEEQLEFELLGHRAAVEPTPRNIAILNNAIGIRTKAAGIRAIGPVCPCGSGWTHYDIDGPDPMQRICDNCGAPVSQEHIRTVVDTKLQEMGDEIRKQLGSQDPTSN